VRGAPVTIALPWKTWLVALGLLAAAVFLWNREHRLRTDAQRSEEAARLALQNQVVENEATKKQLRGQVDELLANNDLLRQAYEEAVRAAPDATPVSASKLETGTLAVKAAPRPVPAPAPPVSGPPPAVDPCALRPGDGVSVDIDVLELLTMKGNTILIGAARVYREIPPPRELLAAGKFQSALSRSLELEAPRPPRWGVLPLGACGFSGCGLGAGVLLPPATLPLVGWRAEPFLGGLVMPSGPIALAGLGIRF